MALQDDEDDKLLAGKGKEISGRCDRLRALQGALQREQYISCDAHTRYSVFVSVDETGKAGKPVRIDQGGRDLRDYLAHVITLRTSMSRMKPCFIAVKGIGFAGSDTVGPFGTPEHA